MSADELSRGATITDGWRALDLFTDRHDAIWLFASYLNDDPARDRILFFHGDGGNGKGDLRSALRQHDKAGASYEAAVAAYDRGLQIAPDYVSALWNKTRVLATRGEAKLRSSRPSEARHLLQRALEGYRRLLEITPADTEIERQIQALEEIIAAIDKGPEEFPAENP
jgi:tetratricopeptide (TPR) repeat protein